jgi:uncharacterized protein YdbL (DUF1318 family)
MARRTLRLAAFLLFALALAGPPPAAALELESARAQGLVGEQTDGFVGLVRGQGSDEARKLVADVNARRRAHYEQIAREQGTPVAAVAALAGQKLIERMPAGTWIGDNGRWYQKK